MAARAIEKLGEAARVLYYRFWSKGRMYWRWQILDVGGYPVVQGTRRNNTMLDSQRDLHRFVEFFEALLRGDTDLAVAATIVNDGEHCEVRHYDFYWKGLYFWRWKLVDDAGDVVAQGLRRTQTMMDSKKDARSIGAFLIDHTRQEAQRALAGEL